MTDDLKAAADLIRMPPEFTARRLVLFVMGSVNAAVVPYWLNWLRQAYPQLETHVLVSRMAERFVSISAIRHLVDGGVWRDEWGNSDLPANPQVEFESIADCFGIFPATLNTSMKLAAGICDSPALLTLQLTAKPIAIASSFPGSNEVVDLHLESLKRRRNVAMTALIPAYSVGKQEWTGQTGFFMPYLLQTLEELKAGENA